MPITDERLDAAFTALADPTRRAIVAHLARETPRSTNWRRPSP